MSRTELWVFLVIWIFVVIPAISYGQAKLGHPSSVWLWCDIVKLEDLDICDKRQLNGDR